MLAELNEVGDADRREVGRAQWVRAFARRARHGVCMPLTSVLGDRDRQVLGTHII